MSYTKHFKKTIDVPVHVSISDPSVSSDSNGHVSRSTGSVTVRVGDKKMTYTIGSHNGGNSDSWNAYEDISVNIEVDTEQYDKNVARCADDVGLLTGSVVATEAAQVKSIDENTKLIASTIVKGFFKNVQADISAQIMEYTHKLESNLLLLRQQAVELQKKRTQMQTDYERTASRYAKLIDDLNKELENRVKAIDMPIYKMYDRVEKESNRMLDGDFVNVSSIVNAENGVLNSQITAAITKKHTLELIEKMQQFLCIQRNTATTINKTNVTPIDNGERYYLPVCYMEKVDGKGLRSTDCRFANDKLPQDVTENARELLRNSKDGSLTPQQRQAILPYISNEVENVYANDGSQHSERVKELIFSFLKK